MMAHHGNLLSARQNNVGANDRLRLTMIMALSKLLPLKILKW